MKNNPLFFDSTKFRGDLVFVTIHIEGVELSLDEKLIVRMIREGHVQRQMDLTPVGLRKWSIETRLEYKEKLKIELVVLNGENIVEVSPPFEVVSCYSIQLRWPRKPQPVAVREPKTVPDLIPETAAEAAVETEVRDPAQKRLLVPDPDWDFDL